jgi:hypothetical protein
MHLRRIFTAYVLTLGLCLVFLGNGYTEQPVATQDVIDGRMTLREPTRSTEPATVLQTTPKGRRTAVRMELGHYDIPLTALLAYQRAAGILKAVKPSCGLQWTLLAAIGRVESDHGRYAGATLDVDGVSTPRVVGVALDGKGPVSAIRDTDGGELDQDRKWDRAVGPMQFLPATWEMVGVDGDGDGTRSVDDLDDAALAAGVYLCAGPEGDLGSNAAKDSALHRYNDSDSYVALVMAYERKYRGGDFDVSTRGGEVAEASAVLAGTPLTGTPLKAASPAEARLQARIKAATRDAVAEARKHGGKTPGVSARPSLAATTASGRAGSKTATAAAGSSSGTPSQSGSGSAAAGSSGSGDPSGSGSPSSSGGTAGAGTSSPSQTPSGSETSTPEATSGSPSPSTSTEGSSPSTSTGGSSSPSTSTEGSSPSTEPSCTPPAESTTTDSSGGQTLDPELCAPGAADALEEGKTCEDVCATAPSGSN